MDGWTQGNVADASEWLSSMTMKLSFVMGNFEMFVKFSTAARNITLGMKVTLSYLHKKCLPWLFFLGGGGFSLLPCKDMAVLQALLGSIFPLTSRVCTSAKRPNGTGFKCQLSPSPLPELETLIVAIIIILTCAKVFPVRRGLSRASSSGRIE